MPDLAIYGGILRSDFPFPDLRPVSGAEPTWRIRREAGEPPPNAVELLGEESFGDAARLEVSKTSTGLRFTFSDTGVFDLSDGGGQIVWYPAAGASLDLARIDVMGRVMAGVLHLNGLFCLHGSAVAAHDGESGIGFLAPKHHGKSTLALAMTRQGAKLVTDDTLPVELADPIRLRPGVHSVRLWSDSAERLAADHLGAGREYGGKHILNHLADDQLANRATTLAAIYLLSPLRQGSSSEPVRRTRLDDVPAAMALVQHTKLGALLGRSEAPVLLERAVATAGSVPVYRLDFVRDFACLDPVVAQLAAWHAMTTSART